MNEGDAASPRRASAALATSSAPTRRRTAPPANDSRAGPRPGARQLDQRRIGIERAASSARSAGATASLLCACALPAGVVLELDGRVAAGRRVRPSACAEYSSASSSASTRERPAVVDQVVLDAGAAPTPGLAEPGQRPADERRLAWIDPRAHPLADQAGPGAVPARRAGRSSPAVARARGGSTWTGSPSRSSNEVRRISCRRSSVGERCRAGRPRRARPSRRKIAATW